DAPAGPSELLVIADDSANPARLALELVGQAEHDPRARALAVVVGEDAARCLVAALSRVEPLGDVAQDSLATHGGVLVADSLAAAIDFANAYAAEHLLVVSRDDERVVAE